MVAARTATVARTHRTISTLLDMCVPPTGCSFSTTRPLCSRTPRRSVLSVLLLEGMFRLFRGGPLMRVRRAALIPTAMVVAAGVAGAATPAHAAGSGASPSTHAATGPAGWHAPGYTWRATTPHGSAAGVAVYTGSLRNASASPDWAV